MAFPRNIDAGTPAGSDSPGAGDDQLRQLKQDLIDIFGVPSATNITAAASKVDADGQWPQAVRLTNRTAGALAEGDVVAISTANDESVVLADVADSLKPFVVLRETTLADVTEGLFVIKGIAKVNTTGAIARGQYISKSATTKVVKDAGSAIGDTTSPPKGAIGVALTAAAAGSLTAYLFGETSVEAGLSSGVSTVRNVQGSTVAAASTIAPTADYVLLRNPTTGEIAVRVNPGSITLTLTTSGPAANGRDQAGDLTANTWVYIYYIWNGTTLATTVSLTGPTTGPTLPTGYTHWAYITSLRIGAVVNQWAYSHRIRGSIVTFDSPPAILTSGAATVETSVSVTSHVPPNALSFVIGPRLWQVTTDGSSQVDAIAKIRSVTGGGSLAEWAGRALGLTATNSFNAAFGEARIPYVGGTFFYLWTVNLGSSPSLTLSINEYKIPNGDN